MRPVHTIPDLIVHTITATLNTGDGKKIFFSFECTLYVWVSDDQQIRIVSKCFTRFQSASHRMSSSFSISMITSINTIYMNIYQTIYHSVGWWQFFFFTFIFHSHHFHTPQHHKPKCNTFLIHIIYCQLFSYQSFLCVVWVCLIAKSIYLNHRTVVAEWCRKWCIEFDESKSIRYACECG